MVQSDIATEPYGRPQRGARAEGAAIHPVKVDLVPAVNRVSRACRGTWARVTIDHFRHLTLQSV